MGDGKCSVIAVVGLKLDTKIRNRCGCSFVLVVCEEFNNDGNTVRKSEICYYDDVVGGYAKLWDCPPL